MKTKRKDIYFFLILVSAIIIATLSWDNINLPFNNNSDYGNQYSEYFTKKYNPLNDNLRFIFFIGFTLIVFIFSLKYFYPAQIYEINEVLKIDYNKNLNNKKKDIKNLSKIFYLFLIIVFFEFLLLDFQNFTTQMDIFHEGLWLTSSNNFSISGKLWTSSYIGRGLFGNFHPAFFGDLLNYNTIGASRFANLFLLLLSKISLLIIAKEIVLNLKYEQYQKIIFFVFLSLLFLSLVEYLDRGEFAQRALLFLVFFNILFFSLKIKNSYIFFTIGLFSIISMLWYIDIGAYLNLIVISILIFFIIRKEFETVISILSGVIVGWLIFYLIVPKAEFYTFIQNTLSIYNTIDMIHGLIYPTPFFSGDGRATRILVFFILAGIFVITLALSKRNNFSNLNKIFFLFLFLGSLVYFKTGLSNSDDGHIKRASGPLLMIIYTAFLYIAFEFINKFKSKNIYIIKNNNFLVFWSFILFSAIVLNTNILKIKNIITAPERIEQLLSYKDEIFIDSNYKSLINYYNNLSSKDNCVQILTDEVALPFLMKKKTCTKFYQMWLNSPIDIQKKLIEELKKSKPKIILVDTESVKFKINQNRIKLVFDFVEKNYSFHSKYQNWTFFHINS